MKKQHIITEAKQIKTYIEKNRKMPTTNTYTDGSVYSIYTTSYLMANLIKNWNNKDIAKTEVRIYNKTKYKDTINEKILKDDYLKMIDKFLEYCKLNKRVPTYIISIKSNTKVSFELFVYCLSKIIVFYDTNKSLPNYCHFNKEDLQIKKNVDIKTSNCTNPYMSLPIDITRGCDGLGQNTSYYCGVCALQKVLRKFGIKISQKDLAKYAGTTSKGTTHQGLRTAIEYVGRKKGVKFKVKEYSFSELGFEKLAKMICKPNVDAITHLYYRLQYGHYEKIRSIDLKKKEVSVVNSLGNKCAKGCFCGYIETRSFAIEEQYFKGISQKSIILITKED